jgi:hypothetical protein
VKLRTQFLLLLFLTCSVAASAQLLIGPTAGPQLSWTSFDDKDYKQIYKVKPVVGFHAGVNVSFRVRKLFFLHTALIYSTKGKVIEGKQVTMSQVSEDFRYLVDPDLKNKVIYRYLEMPILYTYEIKMHAGPNKEFKWYFGVGPNISYWLSGKGTFHNADLIESHTPPIDYKIVFKKDPETLDGGKMNVAEPNRLQLGLNFSAGLVFEPMGFQKVMVTFRYELGHSYLSKDGRGEFPISDSYADVLKARNNGLRLSLAYLIDMKTETRKKGKSTIKHRKMR